MTDKEMAKNYCDSGAVIFNITEDGEKFFTEYDLKDDR